MQKLALIAAVAALISGAGGFYGGTLYGKSTAPSQTPFNGMMRSGTDDIQRFGANGQAFRQTGANLITGEILSKDDSSITVKLRDGGSRIVFLSGSTAISKATQGSKDDLTVGSTVVVTGTSGTDGIMTAETINLGSGLSGMAPRTNP